MLVELTIRNVVLIEQVTVSFHSGLCVLTGETGAGKSILLDSLGLALGRRSDSKLVRKGCDQASVTAAFVVADDHPVCNILRDSAVEWASPLLLRRIVQADGGSRAFINDQPVSVGLLRDVGDCLVEIHGQQDDRGLLSPKGHCALLDSFAGLNDDVERLGHHYREWRASIAALEDKRRDIERAEQEREWLTHSVEELTRLQMEPGEEDQLAEERQRMLQGQKVMEDLGEALGALEGSDALPAQLRRVHRTLERMVTIVTDNDLLNEACRFMEQININCDEVEDRLDRFRREMDFDPDRLEVVESRLFEMRALARKHNVPVHQLEALTQELHARFDALEDAALTLSRLEQDVGKAEQAYRNLALDISKARKSAALELDRSVAKELKPLKLEAARFKTSIQDIEQSAWSERGCDRIEFTIATNPGADFGGLNRIASGGELSRFILALKVALAGSEGTGVLIFDEIDRGVGGSVADAIGERIARLGQKTQVLVVTHSPQVAARGGTQIMIEKSQNRTRAEEEGHTAGVQISVINLSHKEREEEIARMLSAEKVTESARQQARVLLEQARTE